MINAWKHNETLNNIFGALLTLHNLYLHLIKFCHLWHKNWESPSIVSDQYRVCIVVWLSGQKGGPIWKWRALKWISESALKINKIVKWVRWRPLWCWEHYLTHQAPAMTEDWISNHRSHKIIIPSAQCHKTVSASWFWCWLSWI